MLLLFTEYTEQLERRVFLIDVGNMPHTKAQQYLERVKYEVQQKRIPK